MRRWKVRLYQWVARKMPKRLVYFAAIQLMSDVTTRGKLRSQPVPDIRAMDAIGDYDRRYRLEGRR
jgi:hypothetical protein